LTFALKIPGGLHPYTSLPFAQSIVISNTNLWSSYNSQREDQLNRIDVTHLAIRLLLLVVAQYEFLGSHEVVGEDVVGLLPYALDILKSADFGKGVGCWNVFDTSCWMPQINIQQLQSQEAYEDR
jgi:hypothetical protein